MENTFLRAKEPINLTNITEFEQEYKVLLPANYKELLLMYNGGAPARGVFVANQEKSFFIQIFYSLKYGENTLERVLNSTQVWEQVIPTDLLPIACDHFGNDYCISLSDNDYGKIHIWLHDVGGVKSFVANSLEEFLENTITYEEWEEKNG